MDPALHRPQETGRVWAVVIAVAIHVVLGLVFMLVIVLPSAEDEPEVIVEVVVPQRRPAPELPKRNAIKQFNKTAAVSPPSPLTRMMMAEIDLLLPGREDLDMAGVGDLPMGFGEEEIGEELRALGAEELKGGPRLFGLGTVAERVVILVDVTEGMSGFEGMVAGAVSNCLRELSPSVQYQIVLNGGQPGPVRFIDSAVAGSGGKLAVRSGGKAYPYEAKRNPAGKPYYTYVGNKNEPPTAGWLRPTPRGIELQVAELRKQRAEHVWNRAFALQVAHQMKPPADVIYVISNSWGGDSKEIAELLKLNQQKGRPVVHGIVVGTGNGVGNLGKLAAATGGKTLVVYGPRGEAVDGERFLAEPGKYLRGK